MCRYVFQAWGEARAVAAETGKLLCASCAPPGASLYDPLCSDDDALQGGLQGLAPPLYRQGEVVSVFDATRGTCWGGEIVGVRECRAADEPSGIEVRYLVRPRVGGIRSVHGSDVMYRFTAGWTEYMKCYREFDRNMRGVRGRGGVGGG